MTETYVVATSTAAGPQLRYNLQTIAGTAVYTDVGQITDYSSGTTAWTIQSTAIGGRGLVNISGDTVVTNVSGQVLSLSSQLPNLSGLYLASGLHLASGINVAAAVSILNVSSGSNDYLPAWAAYSGKGQLAVGMVDFQGDDLEFPKDNDNFNSGFHHMGILARDVVTSPNKYRTPALDGNAALFVNLSAQTANLSGLFLASGLWLASGINIAGTVGANVSGNVVSLSSQLPNLSGLYLASGLNVNGNVYVINSAATQTQVGLTSSNIPLPAQLRGNYRNVSTGIWSITCSAGAGVNMSGDYLIWSTANTSFKLRVNFLQIFNAGTLSSQQVGFAWTSATGGIYFRTFLQPQQGWNANLVGANLVGSAGASFFACLATVSGTPIDVTMIGETIPGSWVEGANA